MVKETARKANEAAAKARQDKIKAKRGFMKSMTPEQKKEYKNRKANSQAWIKNYNSTIDEATKAAKQEEADWIKEGLVEEEEEDQE